MDLAYIVIFGYHVVELITIINYMQGYFTIRDRNLNFQ